MNKKNSSTISVRSISEILIEADKTDELGVLSDCWEEIVTNKYQYPLAQIKYAREHLEKLAREMGRRDAIMIKSLIQYLLAD